MYFWKIFILFQQKLKLNIEHQSHAPHDGWFGRERGGLARRNEKAKFGLPILNKSYEESNWRNTLCCRMP